MTFVKALFLLGLVGGLLAGSLAQAQGEPTDRPFPVVPTGAPAEPTDRPFPGSATAAAEPTERAFPATTTAADAIVAATSVTLEPQAADIQATAGAALAQVAQLQIERAELLQQLDAAQTDNNATLFALVIIIIGVILALAVFFGLRRFEE